MDDVTRKWLTRWEIPDALYEYASHYSTELDEYIAKAEADEAERAAYRATLHNLIRKLGRNPKKESLAMAAARSYWLPKRQRLAESIANIILSDADVPLLKQALAALDKSTEEP